MSAILDRLRTAPVDLESLDGHHTFHIAGSFVTAEHARVITQLDIAVHEGFYPARYQEERCPFLIALRGTPGFQRVVETAHRRVAESSS